MAAVIASRTPEGEPKRCPFCGIQITVDPSVPPGDAPCPRCGVLLWFDAVGGDKYLRLSGDLDAILERVRKKVATAAERSDDDADFNLDDLSPQVSQVTEEIATEIGKEASEEERAKVRAILAGMAYLATRDSQGS